MAEKGRHYSDLIRKRATIKSQLTKFDTYLDGFVVSKENLSQLRIRLEKIEQAWGTYNSIQEQIEELDDEEAFADQQSQERLEFEEIYFETVGRARLIIEEHSNKQVNVEVENANIGVANGNSVAAGTSVRLPVMSLPTFDGTYEQWPVFFSTFTALVDRNRNLTNVHKFFYLQSALSTNAKKVIESLEINEENYPRAIDLLKCRFDNSRLATRHHTREIFNLKQMEKESSGQLRNLTDSLKQHLEALKALKYATESWCPLIIEWILTRLDPVTAREWEEKTVHKQEYKTKEFIDFLEAKCNMLESVSVFDSTRKDSEKSNKRNRGVAHVTSESKLGCPVCKKEHKIYMCDTFKSLPIQSRITEVRKSKLCLNCLHPNHMVRDCKFGTCKHCNKKHHSLLHYDKSDSTCKSEVEGGVDAKIDESKSVVGTTNSVVTCASKSTNPEILLSTACVHIVDKKGKLHSARALLDNAATLNFITSDLLSKLDLKTESISGKVTGFRGNTTLTSETVTATIKSKLSKYSQDLRFTVIDQITSKIPENQIEISRLQIPEAISFSQLADPAFNVPQKVDLLLGASVFWNILQKGRIQLSSEQPVFQRTYLGWILGGNITPVGPTTRICCTITNEDLNKQLEKFWEVERYEVERTLTPEEAACERHFESTTFRDEKGRFVVSLPIKKDIKNLGNSEHNAVKRLKSIERRFATDPVFHQRYLDFMQEYERMGHMELVSEKEDEPSVVYYLPHHGVTREKSTTTKLRVVFDASCRTSSGVSLNDCLMVGAKVQPDLVDILIRFRQHNYVLTADVSKMFRQIKIVKKDRALQRILWREGSEAPIRKYELTTVTYGTASAPYHAQRCLKQAADDSAEEYPEAAAAIGNDFYMDDFISGRKTVQQLRQLKEEVTQILARIGMELRKWNSNVPELLGSSKTEMSLASDEDTKTLGIRWNSSEDTFRFKVSMPTGACKSKRNILSVIAQIYDPLGLIGPVVVKAKLFMRNLWKLHIDWDDKIPADLIIEWNSYKERLEAMEEIQIPRQVITREAVKIEMHGFCDASQLAFGACIYLCSIDTRGGRTVRLLTSKSRIAPLKTLSIPRLELCSAVLLAKLAFKIKKTLTFPIHQCLYWSDSSIVIHWIRGDPANYKVFVANRVSDIQGLTGQNEWRHVNTRSNPADILSRGIDPRELPRSEKWWSGPSWLTSDQEKWPNDVVNAPREDLERNLKGKALVTIPDGECNLLERFSSLSKLRRIVAYCYRFIESCQKKAAQRNLGPLTADELIRADMALVKMAQRQTFAQELLELSRKKGSVSRNSCILSLNPFLDREGVLRVGGRLKNAILAYNQRFPIIIPPNHPFSTLLIREMHYKNLHAGVNTLSAIIRETYWIISARSEIRRVLRKCILCFRKNPSSVNQIMGNLPAARVNPGRPFAHAGIDYAGPFNIKISRNKSGRAYLAVFVCMATKAVHFEIVSDLSTASFLNTLKRFIARRGKSSNLYSDNGRNFLGARNELNNLGKFLQDESVKAKVLEYTAEQSIKWTFIPAYSPHVGGLWEAAVKSAKSHLKAVTNQTSLTFEELTTIFAQIEAILNSRPLTPVSVDPLDLTALTPGHFLIGTSLTALPEPNLEEIPLNRLSRFQLLSRLVQGFWKRWSREYVTQLQARQKWKKTRPNPHLKINALVLLRDDNAPPLQWRLGRITELFKGSDGLIRTVEVKTQLGLTQRAIQKICVLPLDEQS